MHTPASWTRLNSCVHFVNNFEPNSKTYYNNERGVQLAWSSRAHRKGIPPLPRARAPGGNFEKAEDKHKLWTIERGSIRWMGFDWWDISWWVAG